MKNLLSALLLVQASLLLGQGTVVVGAGGQTQTIDDLITKNTPVVDVRSYGASAGSTDNSAAIQAAITAACLIPSRTLLFPAGNFPVSTTLQVNCKGMRFLGAYTGDGFDSTYGSSLTWSGVGPLIQLGVDDAQPYDNPDYQDTSQGFTVERMGLLTSGGITALLNGKGSYLAGSYAIRDWRSGSVGILHSTIKGFDYAFWGIESDLNYWEDVSLKLNHSGVYIGPRSDQFTINHIYTLFNDTAFQVDSANTVRINDWASDSDGSVSTYAATVMGNYSRSAGNIIFNDPWLENFTGDPANAYDAFLGIGIGSTYQVRGVVINDPGLYTSAGSSLPRTSYIATIDNADSVFLYRPKDKANNSQLQLNGLFHFIGTTTPTRIVAEHGSQNFPTTVSVNTGSGTPSVSGLGYQNGGAAFGAPMYMAGPAGVTRDLVLASGNSGDSGASPRYIFRLSSEAESGTNAGSNFQLLRRDDSGSSLSPIPLVLRRSDGLFTFSGVLLLDNVGNLSTTNWSINAGTGKATFNGGAQFGTNSSSRITQLQSQLAVAGCTTGSTIGSICATPITVTWANAFADVTYVVTCTPIGSAINVPGVPYIVAASKSTSSVQINYMALSAAAASWASIDCVATHL